MGNKKELKHVKTNQNLPGITTLLVQEDFKGRCIRKCTLHNDERSLHYEDKIILNLHVVSNIASNL